MEIVCFEIHKVFSCRYFGPEGMLSYVRDVQRQEIRIQLDCVKHQDMVSRNISGYKNIVIGVKVSVLQCSFVLEICHVSTFH